MLTLKVVARLPFSCYSSHVKIRCSRSHIRKARENLVQVQRFPARLTFRTTLFLVAFSHSTRQEILNPRLVLCSRGTLFDFP